MNVKENGGETLQTSLDSLRRLLFDKPGFHRMAEYPPAVARMFVELCWLTGQKTALFTVSSWAFSSRRIFPAFGSQMVTCRRITGNKRTTQHVCVCMCLCDVCHTLFSSNYFMGTFTRTYAQPQRNNGTIKSTVTPPEQAPPYRAVC